MKELYSFITGSSGVESVQISTAHNAAASVATFQVEDTNLTLGSVVNIELGYVGDFAQVFRGYVKRRDISSNPNLITITAQDELSRAVDFFIASSTPDSAFRRKNIAAEFLIRDILALAGITNYTYDPTFFTFATQSDLEVNLIGAYDFCKQIADILAWHIYADTSGQVHFVDRKPYVVDGDTPTTFISDLTLDILNNTEAESDEDLRNRVVVYGKGDVAATAQASSPYLPAGFFKSTVLATEIIQTNSSAQLAANYNLALLNRLREELNISIEGNPHVFARDIVNVTDTKLGISSENYYAYSVEHRFDRSGYVTNLVLRK